MNVVFLALAIGVGVLVAMQPAMNAEIARQLGTPVGAGIVSVTITLVLFAPIYFLVGVKPGGAALPGALWHLPWWAYLGGAVGAVFVLGGITLTPLIGVAAFVACMVLGQAIGGALIDHYGLMNMARKPIDPWKIAGLVMMVSGLLVFQRGSSG